MIRESPVALPARDGIVRPARAWRGDAAPWLVLVVAHGMGKHARATRAADTADRRRRGDETNRAAVVAELAEWSSRLRT